MSTTASATPVAQLLKRFARNYADLGAKLEPTGEAQADLVFRTRQEATTASAILRDSIAGVELNLRSARGAQPDPKRASQLDAYSIGAFVGQMQDARKVDIYSASPDSIVVEARSGAAATRLRAMLWPQTPYGDYLDVIEG